MASSLALMLPAMNIDDRSEMLGGMHAEAPPGGLLRRARPRPVRARSGADFSTLTRRLELSVPARR